MFDAAGLALDDVRALFETPAESKAQTADHLDGVYGGAEQYLLVAGGLSPGTTDALTRSLLIPLGAAA